MIDSVEDQSDLWMIMNEWITNNNITRITSTKCEFTEAKGKYRNEF